MHALWYRRSTFPTTVCWKRTTKMVNNVFPLTSIPLMHTHRTTYNVITDYCMLTAWMYMADGIPAPAHGRLCNAGIPQALLVHVDTGLLPFDLPPLSMAAGRLLAGIRVTSCSPCETTQASQTAPQTLQRPPHRLPQPTH
eukprot:158751-Chlamydomonas_euryale.AAC.2